MKQIVSIILAVALMASLSLALVGCGESKSEATTGDSTATETAGISETPDPGTEEFESEAEAEAEENMREGEEEIPEFADKQLKSVTQYKVNGDVASEIEYSENGEILDDYEYGIDVNHWTQYQYNEFGLTAKIEYASSSYSDKGYQEQSREEYNYDDNGNLIREITWDFAIAASTDTYRMETVIEHDYDENNNCIATYYLNEDVFMGYTYSLDDFARGDHPNETFEYDENGRLISSTTKSGYLMTNYTYDDNGNIITEKVYEDGSSLSESTVYTYNADNLLISAETYNGDDTLQQITEYVYDNDGNILSETTDNYNGYVESEISDGNKISYRSKTYWKNGELKTAVEKTIGSESRYPHTYENEYDYCGNVILENVYSSSGDLDSTSTYEYTYDEAGNKLTEKIVSRGTTTEYTFVNDYY